MTPLVTSEPDNGPDSDATWSRYNNLFHSPRLGYFVYNSLSNSLLELDRDHFEILQLLRNGGSDASAPSSFITTLRNHLILASQDDEDLELEFRRQRRDARNHEPSRLGLTICPTLGCNFRCSYCFEGSQGDSDIMSDETVGRLIEFVGMFSEARHLSLAWYGGEPLMGFDVMCRLTEAFRSLDLTFGGAALITNGYLMDQRKCARFNDLDIRSVQITVDGPKAVHDRRRFLSAGYPTFDRIMRNIDNLLESTFSGECDIRVNIDRENADAFTEIEQVLLDRYGHNRVRIYAARVTPADGYNPANIMDLREWTEFNRNLSRSSTAVSISNYYPTINLDSVCVATSQARFLIGPRGELYKCWEDVGRPERVIGHITRPDVISNAELYDQYTVQADPYRDEECLACEVLPICGGGCANKRLSSKLYGNTEATHCSPFKHDLVHYLEEYIDIFLNREMCATLLGTNLLNSAALSCSDMARRGYRDISPKALADSSPGACTQCS